MWGIHMNKRETGSCYEELAAVCLQKKGYRIIERNYRCRQGEVDLVCRHGRYLVFVEVKYRSTGRMGGPLEAVDREMCIRDSLNTLYRLQTKLKNRWKETQ